MKPTPRLKDPVYPVPALEKGLDLLEILSAQPAGFALVELAAATGKKVTEIFRMVACLKRRGYIVVDPTTERLTLGMKLFELAHRHPPTERLIAVALSQMQTLAQQTGQSCHLAVHSNGEMLVIAQVDSARHMGFAVHVGAKNWAYQLRFRSSLSRISRGAGTVTVTEFSARHPELVHWNNCQKVASLRGGGIRGRQPTDSPQRLCVDAERLYPRHHQHEFPDSQSLRRLRRGNHHSLPSMDRRSRLPRPRGHAN